MKKGLVVLGILLTSFLAQARSIECTDLKNNETIVSLTDDMGSMVRGYYTEFGQTNEFSPPGSLAQYSYYYGEYLTIKEVNTDEEAVEIVGVRIPGSLEFTGYYHHYSQIDSQTFYATKLKCTEL